MQNLKCKRCSRELFEGENFCPSCGAPVPGAHRDFDDGGAACFVSLLALGNWFAAAGLFYARAARRAAERSDFEAASALAAIARRWAWWGLIPSSAINVWIIYKFTVFIFSFVSGISRAPGL